MSRVEGGVEGLRRRQDGECGVALIYMRVDHKVDIQSDTLVVATLI
jgi:hypothetical protein